MVELIKFKGHLSKWSEGRKIICVPTSLTEMVKDVGDKKVLVRIESIEDE